MKVVCLMAGTSSRLKPLTNDCHKVLLEIGDKTLMEYHLDAFEEAGIEEAVFVIGHKGDIIKSTIGNNHKDIKITYVYNQDYATKNIDYSLYRAKEHVRGSPFIYLEADLLFHPEIMKRMLASSDENCLCVDRTCRSQMVDTLIVGSKGKVEGFIFQEHGDIRERLTKDNAVGEFLPMIRFSRDSGNMLFEELEKDDFEGPFTLYNIFEKVFKTRETGYIYSDGLPWVEIDNHDDLERARKEVCPQLKRPER
jgi:choline kinase